MAWKNYSRQHGSERMLQHVGMQQEVSGLTCSQKVTLLTTVGSEFEWSSASTTKPLRVASLIAQM